MKYYKDTNNKVFAYEADGSQDEIVPSDQVPITEAEALAILAPSPTALIALAHDRIDAAYQTAVNAMTAGYPEDEVKSWSKQETEARAWVADNTVSTPWLDGAALARGITKSELVSKVIEKASLFAPLHGQFTGKRQKLRDEINALGPTPTQAQLDAIQW